MTTTEASTELETYQLLIDGAFTAAQSGGTYSSTDPFTGEPWAEVPDAAAADVDAAVAAARAALSELETRDNGKLFREMVGQTAGLPKWYYYFAGLADKVQGPTARRCRPTQASTRPSSTVRPRWAN